MNRIISGMIYWLSLPQVRFDIDTLQQMDVFVDRWPPKYTTDLIAEIRKVKEGLVSRSIRFKLAVIPT